MMDAESVRRLEFRIQIACKQWLHTSAGADNNPGMNKTAHSSTSGATFNISRRRFLQSTLLAGAGLAVREGHTAPSSFQLNYLLGSAMYGNLPLATVIEETPKTGATHLDVWPKKHGTQREQMDEMGHEMMRHMAALLPPQNRGPYR